MTPSDVRRWTILQLIPIYLLVILACATLDGGETPTSEAPDTLSNEEINVHGNVVFGPGTFNYPLPTASLADLPSYKAVLTLSFDGTNAGQPQKWAKTFVMLTIQEPAGRQLTIEKTGDLADLEPVFMAESDGAAYEVLADQTCFADVIVDGQSLTDIFEPAGFLTGVIGAEEAGSEEVNGIPSMHYIFDERALGETDLAKSTGEMWVASEGGFIVKYLLTTQGSADYFGEGTEGTLTWDYELTDVNTPVTINLPEDCPAGMIDAPQLPDAANLEAYPGLLIYTTTSSVADAAAFYQEQLPTLGWEPTSAPDVFETLAVQDFIQGDQQLSVSVLAEDDGTTTVNLTLGPIQQ